MIASRHLFERANASYRKTDYDRWHRVQSRLHILRSQLGFNQIQGSARPRPCRGCVYYHGIAYGYSRDRRTVLVCGFHPSGWQASDTCPDWRGREPS